MKNFIINFERKRVFDFQKQSFGGILWKGCSWKLRLIHKIAPVLKSLFQQNCRFGQQPYNIKKEIPTQVFSCKFYEIFKNTSSSREHLIILWDTCFWILHIFHILLHNWCQKFHLEGIFNKTSIEAARKKAFLIFKIEPFSMYIQ